MNRARPGKGRLTAIGLYGMVRDLGRKIGRKVAPRFASCGYYGGLGPDRRQRPSGPAFLAPFGRPGSGALRRQPAGPGWGSSQASRHFRSGGKPLCLDAKRKGASLSN